WAFHRLVSSGRPLAEAEAAVRGAQPLTAAAVPAGAGRILSPQEIGEQADVIAADPELKAGIAEWQGRIPLFAGRLGYRLRSVILRLRQALYLDPPESGLPEAERDAIRLYCGYLYNQINGFLRGSRDGLSMARARALQALSRLIESGLDRLPDYQGTVYRHFWTDDPALAERYQAGRIVQDAAFLSATRSRGRMLLPGGGSTSFRLIIESKTGKRVEQLSFRPEEAEVLFRPGARFLVTESRRTSVSVAGRAYAEYVVRLREEDPEPLAGLASRRPDAVLFDWDNTLVDERGAVEAVRMRLFDALGVPAPTFAEADRVWRADRGGFYARFFPGIPRGKVDSTYQSIMDGLRQERTRGGRPLNPLLPGARETLAELKPSPQPILEAMRKLGAAGGNVWYVGDEPVDMAAARAAGARGVHFGPRDADGQGPQVADHRDLLDGVLRRIP
ncbi:MAG: HAD hydrolase-like protein, partial [Elusimicrobia bacterium]|nr:HAD hydrolase-like protein [Elusimicrobiota bacterium]